MSREDIVAIASRLFSAYLLFGLVQTLPGIVSTTIQGTDPWMLTLYALSIAFGFGVCALLWFFPLTVARKLLPVMREPRSEQTVDASIAFSLGITLIGVWFLASGLVDASYWLTFFVLSRQAAETGFDWSSDQIANMLATVFELILSMCLILGNAGIKRLIYKFRYGDR